MKGAFNSITQNKKVDVSNRVRSLHEKTDASSSHNTSKELGKLEMPEKGGYPKGQK